jgi:NAD(P)-dependent dehydrogenase (short-subunit alcohol dehydrogenase family)
MNNARWTVTDIPPRPENWRLSPGQTAVLAGIRRWNWRAGSEVILAARSEAKDRDAVERIRRELPSAKVHFETLDLANLRSVRAFAERVNREAKLDLLVNNAGVMSVPKRQLTADGFELQFGTNFLGPFALTALLMPALERAESPRVTTVSSEPQTWA